MNGRRMVRAGTATLAVCTLWIACGDGTSRDNLPDDTDSGTSTVDAQPGKTDAKADAKLSDANSPDTNLADSTSTTDSGDAGCSALPYPVCDTQPSGATAWAISDVWAANPTTPVYRWISGVSVTAVSGGGCVAGTACEIFLQEGTNPSVASAAHHAIKVFISATAAVHFTGIAAGDKVDIAANAWRYNLSGRNELLLQVADSCNLRGCIKKTGTLVSTPVPATLYDLSTTAAYEQTVGPILVTVSNIAGIADATSPLLNATGALYTIGVFGDAGLSERMSLSPHTMPNNSFVGYTASQSLKFKSVTGVFGQFVPFGSDAGGLSKYLELYPRSNADIVAQ